MREVRQYGCHVFVTWSWHGISLGGMRHDLVEVRVATHLGSVSDDVRGDANVSQSPADSRCTLPFFSASWQARGEGAHAAQDATTRLSSKKITKHTRVKP